MKRIPTRVLIAVAIALLGASGVGIASAGTARASGTADISVTMTGPATVNEGEDVAYSVVVQNAGPDATTGFVLTDTAPTSFDFDPSASFAGTCSVSGSTVTCTVNEDLFVGGQLATRLAFRTTATGTFTNSVTVSETATDPTLKDNSATIDTTVNPPVSADLSVQLFAPASVHAGQSFFATMPVTNNGPDDDPSVSVTLSVPAGLSPEFSGCTAAQTGQTCSFGPGSYPRGTTVDASLEFVAIAPGQQTLSAAVSSALQDPNPSNNTAAATVDVLPAADLAVGAAASPNPVTAGHKVTATIVLTNNGPSPATGTSWTTSWSSDAKGGVALESFGASRGSCTLSETTISCQPGDLANGQQVVLTVVLQPRSKGTLTLDSSASSSVFDPDSSNNSTQTSVTIR